MKLPDESEITGAEQRRLFEWDSKEYFARDPKDFWAIHYNNRLRKIIKCIETFGPAGKKVLDIGCSQGSAAILLAEKGYDVIASDIRTDSLKYARSRHEYGNCQFIALNAEHLPFRTKFDIIILGEFLEHVLYPEKMLKYFADYLNKDGIFVITTPNGRAPHNRKFLSFTELEEKIKSADSNITLEQFGPEREDHVFNFRYDELVRLFKKANFEILKSDFLNSYFINPFNFHKILPYNMINSINDLGTRIILLNRFLSMGLFFVIRKTY